MLDLVKLATLRAVIEHGSFSAAGATLALTQPAVSRQVSLLERQLGAQLVLRTRRRVVLRRGGDARPDAAGRLASGLPARAPARAQLVLRTRRRVVPTQAGRLLLAHAEVILARASLAERQLAELVGLGCGEVRLGSFFTALAYLSAEVGSRLDARHPHLVLRDELVDRRTAFQQLSSGRLDVAIVFEHDFEPDPAPDELELVPLFTDPLRVLLPARHPLAGTAAVSLTELADETWIRPHAGSAARLLDHVFRGHDLAPPLILAGRGDEPAEAQALVAAGKGVMLAHDLNVIVSPEQIVSRRLQEAIPGRHVQAAIVRDHRGPGARAVLGVLLEVGRDRAARLRRAAGRKF